MKIAVIDYNLGNLRSVVNGVRYVGGDPFVATRPGDLCRADGIILPGVGAFASGIGNLHQAGWVGVLEARVLKDKIPFFGICLGMQLLAESSHENGNHQGFGWIKGEVLPIRPSLECPVPHIGWNDVALPVGGRMWEGVKGDATCYFVHSYALQIRDPAVLVGTCTYGSPFVACVEKGHIWGTQFHPEKSQHVGLAVLKNFVEACQC